ncbi:MAG: HAMP domain-containing protein [Nitrospirae bacterium]|nr:HAMP domain-containing protein [Nitrospirota bacterium]
MFAFKSIKLKLFLFTAVLLSMTGGIFIFILTDFNENILSSVRQTSETLLENSLQEEWEKKARAVTELLSLRLIQPVYNFNISEMDNIVSITMKGDNIVYIYVHDDAGRVLVAGIEGRGTKGIELMGRVFSDAVTKNAIAAGKMLLQPVDGAIVDIAAPVMLGQKRLAVVRVGFSSESIRNTAGGMTKKLDGNMKEIALKTREKLLFLSLSALVIAMTVGLLFTDRLIAPIYDLIHGTKKISAGDFAYRINVDTKDEIGQLSDSFNKMAADMQKYLTEKNKMIRDMHDGIGGITTNIILLADMAQNMSSEAGIKKTLTTISELSKEGLSEIRTFMQSLDDKKIDWHGLTADIRHYGSNLIESHGMLFNMTTSIEDIGQKPSSLLSLNLFRVYKEGLTNVIKHSGAKNVDVVLNIDSERLMLSVKDDGAGLKAGNGKGISNMKARAKEIGGKLEITSINGTCLNLEVPIPLKYLKEGMELQQSM